MKHILKYTFSLLFALVSIVGTAQKQDTTKIAQRYGLRVGVDLHRLSKSFYDKEFLKNSTLLVN